MTETEQKVEELVRFMREAGRIPVQRDTFYNEVRRWRPPPRAAISYVNMAPVFHRLNAEVEEVRASRRS